MRNLFIFLFVALIVGCSQATTPVTPVNTPDDITSPKVTQDSSRLLWGLYDIVLDPVNESAEIIPLRSPAFKANVTQFVQPPIGQAHFVGFDNLDFDDFFTEGIVRLQVSITHPFPGLDQYRGFDVYGVFMADASYSSAVDSHAVWPLVNGTEPVLLNADGYTRWFNPTEFPIHSIFGFVPGIYGTPGFSPSGTVCGYKHFADDLDPDVWIESFFDVTVNLDERGSFTPGTVNKRDYEIEFPDPGSPLQYQYAIIASWDEPADTVSPELSDFAPEANQAEPFLLVPDTSESTAYYESETDKGGVVHVDLRVFDWQSKDDLGGIPVAEQIDAIWVESFFDVFFDPVDVLPGATVTPDGPASSVFSFEISSINPTHTGDETLLISVQSSNPVSYDQGFGSPASSGILSAFTMAVVNIVGENPTNQAPAICDITGEAEPMEIDSDEYTVAAYDPEGDPITYSWSLVGDGLDPAWDNIGENSETILIDWNDYGIGEYDLHCRVKDDFNDWQYADEGECPDNPLDISVQELSITCGNDVYGYLGYAWSQCQQTEPAILSDGYVIAEYGYSFTDREFEMMRINYEYDWPGYCTSSGTYDPCEDDWCELYDEVFRPSTDPTNRSIHMDTDFAGTYGPDTEDDDVVAFVMNLQPTIVRFLSNFDNTSQSPATEIATKSIPGGTVLAIDFDEDGDLWVLAQNGDTYELTKSSNYIVGSPEFNVDLSEVAPSGVTIFDWAISYLNGDFYLYTDETDGGTLHRLSGTSGTVVETISNALDAGVTNPAYGLGPYGARGDVEIDHRVFTGENPLAENCRLIVSGGPGGTGTPVMFARYDQALNLLSTWDWNQPGGGTCDNPPSNDGGRFIIFDPVDHTNDDWDHTMWVGDAGTSAGNMVWVSDGRPAPADWDGY